MQRYASEGSGGEALHDGSGDVAEGGHLRGVRVGEPLELRLQQRIAGQRHGHDVEV